MHRDLRAIIIEGTKYIVKSSARRVKVLSHREDDRMEIVAVVERVH